MVMMVLDLNEKDWKEFFLTDIFPTIQRGKRLIAENQISGAMPYVSSSATSNGVSNYISNSENVRIFYNCLSLANSGSVGASFYEPFAYVASDHVTHLKNENFCSYDYLFIAALTNRLSQKYNFNREINDNRISREKILLPVDENDNPDYDYMRKYIKEREIQKRDKYLAFAKSAIAKLEYCKVLSLEEKQWSEFLVLDLFDYKRGNQNNMNSLKKGADMLISAKNVNNGLKGFFTSSNERKGIYQGNCITLNNDGDGGVGLAYYQPHEFLLDTHVYALYPKRHMSKYTMLYITSALSKQRVCFSHGYSISQDRLRKMKIMLPCNDQNNPDYEYMEQYTKNLMLRKYRQYLDYVSTKS